MTLDEAQGVHCNQTSYYLYDGRGSVTANTWYNGMVTDVYQYDPYGQVTLGSTEHTDFYGYNAESYNPNSGLEYLRARYYNAKQGRFFQEDTYLGAITDPLTLNRYAYVKNSPMNYTDPSGHETVNEFYNHLPNYLTGDSRDDDPFPYGAGQQAEWYKRHYPNGLQHGSSLIDDLIESLEGYLSEMMGWAKEYGNAFACDPLGNITDIGIGIAYSFLENIVLRPAAGLKSYLTMGGFDAEAWLNSYEQAVINDKVKNSQSFYIGQLLGDAFQSVLLIMNSPTLVNNLAGALMAAASILSTGGIDMSVGANGAAMLVSAGVSERTAGILAESLGVAGSAVVAQLVLAMGGSIIDDVDKLAQSVSNGGGKGESNPVKPEAAVTGSKKHGVNWKEGPARAKATGNPQGQWAKSDLDYATEMANTLKPGESAYFDLPEGSQSIVHMPDGTTQPATRMWIRNNGTGTWHGYPMQ